MASPTDSMSLVRKHFWQVVGPRIVRDCLTQEIWFELDHAGAGQQEGRIAVWNQRGARHNLVSPLLEESQKQRTQFVSIHG